VTDPAAPAKAIHTLGMSRFGTCHSKASQIFGNHQQRDEVVLGDFHFDQVSLPR